MYFKQTLLLALALQAFVGFTEAFDFIPWGQLTSHAMKIATPLTESLTKLQHQAFGKGRAARSSDILIMNKTDRKYTLELTKCEHGGFSKEMFPPDTIEPQSTASYGVESGGFITGIDCTVKYVEDNGGSWIKMTTENPYFGKNKSEVRYEASKGKIIVQKTVGKGTNNLFRFVIYEQRWPCPKTPICPFK